MLFFLVGSEVTALNVGVEGVGKELAVLLSRHIDSTQLLCRMIDLTIVHVERLVEMEQRCITPIGKYAAVGEGQTLVVPTFDEFVLAIIKEVTMRKIRSDAIAKLDDAVGAVVDVGIHQGEVRRTHQVEAIGAATIEVAVLDERLTTTLHADNATRAVAALSMSNSKIMDFAILAIDEIDAVGVTGIDLDARIPLTLDDQALHVEQCQLTAVGLAFADSHRSEQGSPAAGESGGRRGS